MMRDLLPPNVSVADELLPAHVGAARLASADLERRSAESLAGRRCAALALRRMGAAGEVAGPGPHGEPVWPAGVVGSITHRHRYVAAAVAWTRDVAGLGIDAERSRPLSPGVVARVCRAEEAADLDLERQPLAATAVFSLKEAIYKAVFSATAIELDYANASIAWTPNGPVVTFVGDVTRAPELAALTLATRVAIGPEWVLAAATLRRTS